MVVLLGVLAVLFLIAVAGWSRTHMRLQGAHSALVLAHNRGDLHAARAKSAEVEAERFCALYVKACADLDLWLEAWAAEHERGLAAEAKVARMTSRTKGARGRFVAAD